MSHNGDSESGVTPQANDTDYDVLVVGSGFGGSVAALRLVEKGYTVRVLEAGKRYSDAQLPETSWDLKKFLWAPALGMYGIQRVHLLKDVMILAGAGVGGGSLNYANTLYKPGEAFFADQQWTHITDWDEELTPHYDQASRMLGVVHNPSMTPSDHMIKEVAEDMGVGHTFRLTPVGVFFGEKTGGEGAPGQTVADPYFGGKGPQRTACDECGSCMTGCRKGSKNTLVKNYLALAEQAGVEISDMSTVTGLKENPDRSWTVNVSTTGQRGNTSTITASHVVLAAGSWGTQKLLHYQTFEGKLPRMSSTLGRLSRTNSESILGANRRTYDPENDYSQGVAITSSFFPDDNTHIEPVRYGVGSNAIGLLQTLLTEGGKKSPRIAQLVTDIATRPHVLAQLVNLRQWSQRTIIMLVMQNHENSLVTFVKKVGPFKFISSRQGHGKPSPKWIPVGNEATRRIAAKIDGIAGGTIGELFGMPLTAHYIGGCVLSDSVDTGVIDPYHRVWNYPTLHVTDGSAVPANLGVNPSLTITAMAERAYSLWPNKGSEDTRPDQSQPYQKLTPVAPDQPIVPQNAPGALKWAHQR